MQRALQLMQEGKSVPEAPAEDEGENEDKAKAVAHVLPGAGEARPAILNLRLAHLSA